MNTLKNILIIIIVSLNGCVQREDMNQQYSKMKAAFPDEFVNFFPKSVAEYPTICFYKLHIEGEDNTKFELISKIDSNNIGLINKIRKTAIKVYSANDSCLNIVNRKYNLKNESIAYNLHLTTEEKQRFFIPCIINNLPVPNFYDNDYVDTLLTNRLSSDFKLYVLEAKSGKYWQSRHWTKGFQMSPEWKNGYSKGIAVSEKKSIVIFWFIIW